MYAEVEMANSINNSWAQESQMDGHTKRLEGRLSNDSSTHDPMTLTVLGCGAYVTSHPISTALKTNTITIKAPSA